MLMPPAAEGWREGCDLSGLCSMVCVCSATFQVESCVSVSAYAELR